MRGVEEPADPVPDNVTVLSPKRPNYTHKPSAATIWGAALSLLAVLELAGLRFNVEWTLSRTVWWILGPAYEPRWWLLGLPLWALLLWTGPHFLWPHLFGPLALTLAVGVALAVAGVGTFLTLH